MDIPGPDPAGLTRAAFEARDEAAPFALAAVAALAAMAIASRLQGWHLSFDAHWWVWLVAAAPQLMLAVALVTGLGRPARAGARRALITGVLGVVPAGQVGAPTSGSPRTRTRRRRCRWWPSSWWRPGP